VARCSAPPSGSWVRAGSHPEKIMVRAFHEVMESAEKNRVNNRTGAYVLAVDRVARATKVRGLFP